MTNEEAGRAAYAQELTDMDNETLFGEKEWEYIRQCEIDSLLGVYEAQLAAGGDVNEDDLEVYRVKLEDMDDEELFGDHLEDIRTDEIDMLLEEYVCEEENGDA